MASVYIPACCPYVTKLLHFITRKCKKWPPNQRICSIFVIWVIWMAVWTLLYKLTDPSQLFLSSSYCCHLCALTICAKMLQFVSQKCKKGHKCHISVLLFLSRWATLCLWTAIRCPDRVEHAILGVILAGHFFAHSGHFFGRGATLWCKNPLLSPKNFT